MFPFASIILQAPATLLSYSSIPYQVARSIAWLKLFIWLESNQRLSLQLVHKYKEILQPNIRFSRALPIVRNSALPTELQIKLKSWMESS